MKIPRISNYLIRKCLMMNFANIAGVASLVSVLFVGNANAQTYGNHHTGSMDTMTGKDQTDNGHHGTMPGHHYMTADEKTGVTKTNIEVPGDLDTSRSKLSRNKRFNVVIKPEDENIAINVMHRWIVEIATSQGRPVANAKVSVDGGMPSHGHGLPTSPRVTKFLGDGKYLVEGMKFNMAGWWELKFAISSGDQSDHVTFNVVLK